jgi:hypothetical protein
MDQNEHSLARALNVAERQTSSADEHLLSRQGHVFGNRSYRVPFFTAALTTFVARTAIREHLLQAIPPDCDQIVEIGGGKGDNLFHLWLGGGPRDAEYLSLEPNAEARATSIARGAMEPRMAFRAEDFDISTMQGFGELLGDRRRSFVFTCSTLTLLPSLRDDFFDRLLDVPAVFAGMHFEQGGWQARSGPISASARAYDKRHHRNESWTTILGEAHRAGRLSVHEFMVNAFALHALAPFSIAGWSRSPRPVCPIGSPVSFSASGEGASMRRYGWSDPEDWGCWIDGSEAGIHLALDAEPPGDTWLFVDARAPGPDLVTTKLSSDEGQIAVWKIGPGRRQYRAHLPRELWRPFNSLELVLSTDRSQSPFERGNRSDERHLSVGVYSLTIQLSSGTAAPV